MGFNSAFKGLMHYSEIIAVYSVELLDVKQAVHIMTTVRYIE